MAINTEGLYMILSEIFAKVQRLDNKIKLLSELTPELKNTIKQYPQNTEKKPRIIIQKVNELEQLVSQLNVC